jgi:hypothetical protein
MKTVVGRDPKRVALLMSLLMCATVAAQRGGGGQGRGGGGAASARAAAPVDLTGTWISIVTEDWRYRMVTPARGDHPSVPLNAAGNALANQWDPAKDEAAGELCKAFGALGVMRMPGRLRISWQDDMTLKIDTEAGTQTRLLRFGPQAADAAGSLMGEAVASWEVAGARGGRRGGGAPPSGGNLKVVTTKAKPGYLQKNGVPYSANAVQTEYFNRTVEGNGDSWLILTAIVEDPQYLTGPFIRSTHYKRVPDTTTTWEPEPCSAK